MGSPKNSKRKFLIVSKNLATMAPKPKKQKTSKSAASNTPSFNVLVSRLKRADLEELLILASESQPDLVEAVNQRLEPEKVILFFISVHLFSFEGKRPSLFSVSHRIFTDHL